MTAIGASQDPATPSSSGSGIQVTHVAFTLLSAAIVILLLRYMQQGQALTVIDQLPEGARTLAQSLRKARGAEPSPVTSAFGRAPGGAARRQDPLAG
jgi:hypothetical protein